MMVAQMTRMALSQMALMMMMMMMMMTDECGPWLFHGNG